ncbi:hypothetical protein Q5H93_03845 [Hymenobacter sp. ASUV-10]|uniref:Uncharacterized protein n=1 Tax=Hymenobacter aranciens TaxID=3063996 RepID=A0ABT9BBD1_9BACT|nr:hypothetical protein [Hymenobacter sp. ASUV-10]MDO7873853.1 hypothetical protein [Hymenobacter sp. ASUV-10]
MKEQTYHSLRQLVGLMLTGSTRAADMECLKFGEQAIVDRSGELYNIGEFALHLQCPWRITSSEKLLVGSSDLYEPADGISDADEDFDWEIIGNNLRDVRLQQLLIQSKIVEAVETDAYGGFSLFLSQDLVFSAFPSYSKNDEYHEYWRLLDNREGPKPHIVVGPNGVEFC